MNTLKLTKQLVVFREEVGVKKGKCRHCMDTFDTMQEHFEEVFELRDHDCEDQLWDTEIVPSQYLKQYFLNNVALTSTQYFVNYHILKSPNNSHKIQCTSFLTVVFNMSYNLFLMI